MREIFDQFESSNIARLGYIPTTETLEVEFLNGSLYQYFAIPNNIWQAFKKATSKGRFLNLYLRDKYPYIRVK